MRAIFTRFGRFYAPGPLLAAAFALLLLGAGAAAVCFAAAQDAALWSRHTLNVGLALDKAQILVMRAEINRRGYVMTGDPAQRDAYRLAANDLDPALDTLAGMVSDNPRQHANVARLRALLDDRLADMAAGVGLRDAGRLDAAVALTRGSRGAIGRAIRVQDVIRAEERRLLRRREGRAATLGRLGGVALATIGLLLVLLAALVWDERRGRIQALSRALRDQAIDMALREQAEEQLEILAANATDAVLRTTLAGDCLYASPSAQEVFGVAASWLVGRSLLSLIDPADRAVLGDSLARLAAGESARELVTCRQRRPVDGAVRWLEASSRLVRDPITDVPREIIAAVRDVTARKELEFALESARLRAEEAAQAKAAFLANMSHEIRTPMNGVLGFTELMLVGELTPDQRRHIELIAQSGREMMRLLNDILDLSKIEAGRMSVANDVFDAAAVLRACSDLMAPVAQQKGLSLSVAIDPALPPRLVGDPLRLRQILLNLIGNAVKFTSEGGVAVIAAVTDDRLRIAVGDTGIGIAPERLGEVFDHFVQAEESTTRRFGGTGLGLSISAELARLMGGRIEVESTVGSGSTFTLDLPLRCGEEAAPSAPAPAAPNMPLARARVLIAEDHDINQTLITAMARRIGVEPTIAANGAEAIAAVAAAAEAGAPFALVLMDLRMPEVDGLEATRRLRAAGYTPEALPIVALTANAFPEDIRACLDAGMQGHLAKPVQIEALSTTIARYARVEQPAPKPVGISPALAERYLARKNETLDAVEALLAQDFANEADLRAVLELLHKLSGTASMFGDPALGEQAHVLETNLAEWLAADDRARASAAVAGLRAVA